MTEISQVSRQRPFSVAFPTKAGTAEEGHTNDNRCMGMLLKDTICSVYSNTSCPPSLNGYPARHFLLDKPPAMVYARSVNECSYWLGPVIEVRSIDA
jgi:hypothetical protein